MNSKQKTDNGNDFLEDIGTDDLQSVDDFFKELEAKEKDLHISSDLVIEVEDSEFDERNMPTFPMDQFLPPDTKVPQPSYAPKSFQPKQIDPVSKFEDEIEELKKRILKMEAERVEIFENSQRRSRDFENYKNRTERDREENLLAQVCNLATELLPVLDNLGRALECAPQSEGDGPKDFKQFFDGIVLVSKQLHSVLDEMGIHPISAIGEHFDPHYHEAVAIEETAELPPNMVMSELLRGYRVGEKVIRAAMVRVSVAPKNEGPAEAIEEPGPAAEDQGNAETIEVVS